MIGLLRRALLDSVAMASIATMPVSRPSETGPSAPSKPNIVYLLIDDLAWTQVGFNGGQFKTPNINKLAAEGALLSQFYVQPVCTPTRAAFLTGRYPMRQGLQVGTLEPWAQYGLPLNERTLATALKEAGYVTAICGKWHLGHFDPAYLPTRRGFDHQYGCYNGGIDYFTHNRNGGLDWHRDDKVCKDAGYSTDLIASEACGLIAQYGGKQPLFLYVAFNAVHKPIQAPRERLDQFADLPLDQRALAATIKSLDDAIGRIVGALDDRSLRSNTLIVFSGDNGGNSIRDNRPFRGRKDTLYEGGIRVPACANWQGVIKPGTVVARSMHIVDWYPTFVGLAGGSLQQALPLDGKDVWPMIVDGKPSPHEDLLLNTTPTGGAIRVGDWKLIIRSGRDAESGDDEEADGPPAPDAADAPPGNELYDLESDPTERHNLAAAMPGKVAELLARYQAYASQAIPPRDDPRKPADFRPPPVWGE